MKWSPSEDYSIQVSQEIPHHSYNLQVHYHNSLPETDESQHILTSHFFKFQFTAIFLSTPRISKGLFPSSYPTIKEIHKVKAIYA
jgi:hypothetical protein